MDPRIAVNRLRVAFIGLVSQAKRMPDCFYDLTEKNRKVSYPFEREREFMHKAIHQGCTTPNAVLTYYLARLADDLSQFDRPVTARELCYVRLMAELADVAESGTLARGLGTEDAVRTFQREAAEVIPIAHLAAAGACFPLPMGATPR